MLFEDKIIEIINVLENDGIVLLPTDSYWCMACSSESEFGYRKIRSIVNIPADLYLCTDSIKMMKKYAPLLHPRIETLLCFYERPVNIKESNHRNIPTFLLSKECSEFNISLSKDEFLNTIISLLGNALVLVRAHHPDEMPPKSLEKVSDVFKSNADYICKHRKNDTKFADIVTIKYDHFGMLVFEDDDSITLS